MWISSVIGLALNIGSFVLIAISLNNVAQLQKLQMVWHGQCIWKKKKFLNITDTHKKTTLKKTKLEFQNNLQMNGILVTVLLF